MSVVLDTLEVEVEGDHVLGLILGRRASRHTRHRKHRGRWAAQGERCSACRWTRVTLLRDTDPAAQRPYVIVTEGLTKVPGEVQFEKAERTSSAAWVVEWLRRVDRTSGEEYWPTVAIEALEQAGEHDPGLARAWAQRRRGADAPTDA